MSSTHHVERIQRVLVRVIVVPETEDLGRRFAFPSDQHRVNFITCLTNRMSLPVKTLRSS